MRPFLLCFSRPVKRARSIRVPVPVSTRMGGAGGARLPAGALFQPVAVEADRILQRASGGEIAEALHRGPGDVAFRLGREERLVRGHDHVRERHEAGEDVVEHGAVGPVLEEIVGLLLVDVEPGGADPPALQAVHERGAVDEASAAGVDEHDALLHHGDGFVVDHVVVLRRERAVERDDVALAEDRFERDVLEIQFARVFGVRVRIVRQHAHPEAAQQPDERASDLARADHADRLAAQVESHEAADGEIALADAVVRPVDLPVQRHEQRERVFGDGVGRILRHADDLDPELAGGLQVHVVIPGAAHGDELHAVFVKLFHHLLVQLVVHERADGVESRREVRGARTEFRLEIRDVEPVLFVFLLEEEAVVRLRVEYGDAEIFVVHGMAPF